MGYTPRQVDEMTLWEFRCIDSGYRKANSNGEGESATRPPSKDEYEGAIARFAHLM